MSNHNILQQYTSDKPQSFGGAFRFYDQHDKKKVLSELSKNETYTKFKQYKKPRRYSPIFVREKRELFQSDSIYMDNQSFPAEENDGFKFLFVTIDCFTKFLWVFPLKNLKCETTVLCMKEIFSKCGKLPKKIQSDRGKELDCKPMRDLLSSLNIIHYFSFSERKCAYVERVNLTIQNLLRRITHHNSSSRWIDYLEQALEIYHSRWHRGIKMTPYEAEKEENQNTLLNNHQQRWFKNTKALKKEIPAFKIGDTVRIFVIRSRFIRGYDENYTNEYFTVVNVDTKLPTVRYQLEDYDKEKIIGSFFQNELIHYTPGDDSFPVQLIGKPRLNPKTKKVEQFVSYVGWPKKYNTWLPLENLT